MNTCPIESFSGRCVKRRGHAGRTHECWVTRRAEGVFAGLKVSWIHPLSDRGEDDDIPLG